MKAEYDFSKGKRGALLSTKGKTRITIYLDNDIVDAFRSRAEKEGTGYQTMINNVLRASIKDRGELVRTSESILRRVLSEVLGNRLLMTKATRRKAPRTKRKEAARARG